MRKIFKKWFWLGHLGLSLVILELVCCLSIECVLCVPRMLTYSEELGWVNVNKCSVIRQGEGGDVRYDFNESGYRQVCESESEPRQKPVILILGDSFAFGFGVDAADRFDTYLCKTGKGGSYGVVNCGVSGYSTDQELILLKKIFPQIKPDIVVLMTYQNDFEELLTNFPYNSRRIKPKMIASPHGVEIVTLPGHNLFSMIVNQSYSARILAWLIPFQSGSSLGCTEGEKLFMAIRQTMAQYLLPHNVLLVNCVFTHLPSGKYQLSESVYRGDMPNLKIINLDSEFAETGCDVSSLYFRSHNHWNKRGHRLVGRILLARLDGFLAVSNYSRRQRHGGDH